MTRVAVLLRGMAILALTLTAAGSRAESLYDPGLYRSLGTDRKAARIGDVLTIQVVETSSASSAADTSTGRKSLSLIHILPEMATLSAGCLIR